MRRTQLHKQKTLNVVPLVDVSDSHPFVSECIDMLATGAAPGPDGIPAVMIKSAKGVFARMLSNIMRATMDSGKYQAF